MGQTQYNKDSEILEELFKRMPKEIEVLQTTRYSLTTNQQVKKEKSLTPNKRLSIEQFEQQKSLSKNIDKLLKGNEKFQSEFYSLSNDISLSYKIGDTFHDVTDLKAIETQGFTSKSATWKHKQGIITLVIIWSADDSDLQTVNNLKLIHQILVENSLWKNKVEIVAFSQHQNYTTPSRTNILSVLLHKQYICEYNIQYILFLCFYLQLNSCLYKSTAIKATCLKYCIIIDDLIQLIVSEQGYITLNSQRHRESLVYVILYVQFLLLVQNLQLSHFISKAQGNHEFLYKYISYQLQLYQKSTVNEYPYILKHNKPQNMAGKQLKEDLQAVLRLIEQIPQETEVLQTTRYTLNLEKYEKERTIKAKTQLSIAQYEQYVKLKALNDENLKEKEETLKSYLNGFIDSLTPQYNLGDKFQEVDGIEAIELEGYTAAPATWKPKEGIVTLISIWATWCYPNQNPNQEMLEMNQNWQGKVEIVGLSVDDELAAVTSSIQQNTWTSINHYRFTKGWDRENLIFNAFKLRGIPFVALLDKQGKIVYKGHPSEGKLEETINKLIAEEYQEDANANEVEQQEKQEQHVLLDKAEFKALKAKVSGEIQEFLKKLKLPESEVELVLVKTNQVSAAGKVPQQRTQVKVNYSVPKAHKAKLDEFLTFLNNSLPDKVIIGKAKILDPEGY